MCISCLTVQLWCWINFMNDLLMIYRREIRGQDLAACIDTYILPRLEWISPPLLTDIETNTVPLLTQCWTQSLTRADDLQPKRNVNLTPLLQFFVVVRTKVSKYSPFLPRGELTSYPNINGTSDPNFNLSFTSTYLILQWSFLEDYHLYMWLLLQLWTVCLRSFTYSLQLSFQKTTNVILVTLLL